MKCYVLISSMVLALFGNLFGRNSFPCGHEELDPKFGTIQDQMEAHLQSGVWTLERSGNTDVIYFLPGNRAQFIAYHNSEVTHYISYSWETRLDESGSIYFLLDQKGAVLSQQFEVFLSCESLEWSNKESGMKQIFNFQEANAAQLLRIKSTLEGEWQNANVTNSDELKYLGYKLNKQSQYKCQIQRELFCSEQLGDWSLSMDGKYIFLKPDDGASPYVVRLKYLELDEMVLEYATIMEDNTLTNIRSYFFNRI